MDNKRQIAIIENGNLEKEKLINDKEKETALEILKCLEGHLIIRADKILDFCKKAIIHKKY